MSQDTPLPNISFFISSTYIDMVQHRNAVIGKIQSKSGIINAQEFFGARDSQPLDTCLREVERSQVFLLFLSPRNGSIDPESGKSFVEREYEKACERGILKLAYIMDEEYEYPIKYVSRGEEAQSLEAFKQRVMTELTVSRFTTPEDLASKVYEDLKRELPRSGFAIGAEDERDDAISVIDTLRRFCLLPKILNGSRVHLKATLGEIKRASESQCNALSLKRGQAIACDIYAEDNAISELLLDTKILLFAEGRAAESLLDVQHRNSVIVEAQTVYGVIRVRTPYYGYEYETGAFDSVLSKLSGRQRVITGYEEVKEELLGLYLKEVSMP
jgi:hypothetical protein